MEKKTRVSVDLNTKGDYADLVVLCERNGISKIEAVRRAVRILIALEKGTCTLSNDQGCSGKIDPTLLF
jgi:hypothetical protein